MGMPKGNPHHDMMPNGDPKNRFFYPILTLMMDSYIIWILLVLQIKRAIKNKTCGMWMEGPAKTVL